MEQFIQKRTQLETDLRIYLYQLKTHLWPRLAYNLNCIPHCNN